MKIVDQESKKKRKAWKVPWDNNFDWKTSSGRLHFHTYAVIFCITSKKL
jgi:hypothetical protein